MIHFQSPHKENRLQKVTLLFFVSLFNLSVVISSSFADCRGCCSGHGGLKCVNGVTICVDGTPLSENCLNKGCDICGDNNASLVSDTIKIANFNIQVFGRTKAKKIEVMETLANTITRFDIVAIQEIRDKTGRAIKDLEVTVDNLGTNFDFIISQRLGRSNSKEQYAYFYKTDSIIPESSYTFDDSTNDDFHREPFIAKFKAKNGNFDFVLVTIHTDPDKAEHEIKSLHSAVTDAQQHFANEPDIIILGDLNADCTYFDDSETDYPLKDPAYTWLITNDMDTNLAKSSCAYDRIIITSSLSEDYAGVAGVFRFDQEFELDCEPDDVSDHYPVFSEFKIGQDSD